MKITRRGFLMSGAAIGGGLIIGFSLWPDSPLKLTANEGEVLLNGWVKIGRDGIIHAVVPQSEMGQGVTTSIPMLLAEELDADFAQIRYEQAPVDGIYVNQVMLTSGVAEDETIPTFVKPMAEWAVGKLANYLEMQATGGSSSIRNFWRPVRVAGAAARQMLVTAAAKKLKVAPSSLRTAAGYIYHDASDSRIAYGDLVDDAALISPPRSPKLKNPSEYNIIGTPQKRLDIHEKVTGRATFGLDIRLPNMVYAAVRAVPATGGEITNISGGGAQNGTILKTIVRPDFVAVVASHYWYAKQRVESLNIDLSGTSSLSSQDLDRAYNSSLEDAEGYEYKNEGDVDALSMGPETWLEARYDVPFLAHACMEPMNCTVEIGDGTCTIWSPTQSPSLTRDVAAKMLDIDKDKVTVHTTLLGGGFGRKVEVDALKQAIAVAQELNQPVQLIWTREEDTQHDMYRPKFATNMAALLADDGQIKAIKVKSTSQSVTEGFMNRMFDAGSPEPDPSSVEGIANTPYAFSNFKVNHVAQPHVLPVGFWRSVGHSANAFFMESFMDEVAQVQNKDPFSLRRELLTNNPRALKLLDRLEKLSGWSGGQVSAEGNKLQGRGMAFHQSFGSMVGQVADVSLLDGQLHVDRVFVVVDCGQTVNPDTIKAQMESGVIYGLTAALYGQINLDNGDVVESNFHDYRAVTIENCPDIITEIIADGDDHGGIGEPATPPIAPAVANAIFAATQKRIRALPLSSQL